MPDDLVIAKFHTYRADKSAFDIFIFLFKTAFKFFLKLFCQVYLKDLFLDP